MTAVIGPVAAVGRETIALPQTDPHSRGKSPCFLCTDVHTMGLFAGFEWDGHKARANFRKHGVDLAGAVAVFEDEMAVTIRDDISAVDEQRYLSLGRDMERRILVVAYTWRGDRIRIFSARRATASERRQYLDRDR